MALEKLTEDVAVHQRLGDEPNAENGLTADDLKKLFDKPAELIKAFINDKLVPNAVDRRGDSMAGALSVPAPTAGNHAANKDYVDSKVHLSYTEPEDWKHGDIWLMPIDEE